MSTQFEPSHSDLVEIAIYLLVSLTILFYSITTLLAMVSAQGVGLDYHVYQQAVVDFNAGKDPYILSESLPYSYTPYTLILLELLPGEDLYYPILVCFILISIILITRLDKQPHYFFVCMLVSTAFMNLYWNFFTGNLSGVFFLFFLSISMYFLSRKKYTISALFIGIMSMWSVFPLVFSAVFIAVPRSVAYRIKLILVSFSVPVVLMLITYALDSSLTMSFLGSLTSPYSALKDGGGTWTPQPSLLLQAVSDTLKLPVDISGLLFFVYGVGVVLAAWYFIRKNAGDTLKVYGFILLSAFMLMPRIKPYYLILLVVPLYLLMKDYDYRAKIFVFLSISTYPVLFYLNEIISPGARWFPSLFYLYAQLLALMFIFAFITFYRSRDCI